MADCRGRCRAGRQTRTAKTGKEMPAPERRPAKMAVRHGYTVSSESTFAAIGGGRDDPPMMGGMPFGWHASAAPMRFSHGIVLRVGTLPRRRSNRRMLHRPLCGGQRALSNLLSPGRASKPPGGDMQGGARPRDFPGRAIGKSLPARYTTLSLGFEVDVGWKRCQEPILFGTRFSGLDRNVANR